MNLTWHLIRKDIYRGRASLLCWLLALGYLTMAPRADHLQGGLRDYLQLTALLSVVILGFGLIADIVQADHPTRNDAHWRTLPISAGRIMMAKLLAVGLLFVALPVAILGMKNLTVSLHYFSNWREYLLVGFIFSSVALGIMATASCTSNVVQCLLLWLGLVLGTTALMNFLDQLAPVLDWRVRVSAGFQKMLTCHALSVACSLAVMLNQYWRRRPVGSVVLLASGSAAIATIASLWGYFYFYHA